MTARPTTLVISNIAWNFAWQRHQTLASFFARDRDVIFCELPGMRRVGWRDARRIFTRWRELSRSAVEGSIDPVPKRLCIQRPFVLPATNRAFCAINAYLLDRFLARNPALWQQIDLVINYSPTRTAQQLLDRVPHGRLVYDCTDDFVAMRGRPSRLVNDERTLLARADLTLVPSRRLEELKRPLARRLERLPHGALVERFLLDPKPRVVDGSITVLYYGHLLDQHLDFAAIAAIARECPHWRVILIGPVKTKFAFPANVEVRGQLPHDRLRDAIATADVLLLPYALNDYTRSVMPAKTYECLATGRPIVASPLPELVAGFFAHLRFVGPQRDWVAQINSGLAGEWDAARAARIELAKANTWESRFQQICRWLKPAERPAG
jgi:glycosyltransferase involved in cell wall biosynthesis